MYPMHILKLNYTQHNYINKNFKERTGKRVRHTRGSQKILAERGKRELAIGTRTYENTEGSKVTHELTV